MDDSEFAVSNMTIEEILKTMVTRTSYIRSRYPILNETGFKGRVGKIQIKGPWLDPTYFDKELTRFGLRFTLQKRPMDVLVLQERTSPKF